MTYKPPYLEATGSAVRSATAGTGAAGTGYRGRYSGIVDAEAGKGGQLTSGRFMAMRAGRSFIRLT